MENQPMTMSYKPRGTQELKSPKSTWEKLTGIIPVRNFFANISVMCEKLSGFLTANKGHVAMIQMVFFFFATKGANEHLAAPIHTATVSETALADLKYWSNSVGYPASLVYVSLYFLNISMSIYTVLHFKKEGTLAFGEMVSNVMAILYCICCGGCICMHLAAWKIGELKCKEIGACGEWFLVWYSQYMWITTCWYLLI